jgi:hypothetical protein
MLTIMHDGDPYGHLTMEGRPIAPDMLARLIGETPGMVKRLMKELEENNVFSRTDAGIIFSRRMVRDEEARERRAEVGRANGAKGAEFGHRGKDHGKKGGRPRKVEGEENPGEKPPQEPGQNPRPSSSSPSPSSDKVSEEASASPGADAPRAPPTAAEIKKAIFDSGKDLLAAAGCKNPGAMLQKWRQTYPDAVMLDVLTRCAGVAPEQPVSWITAALQSHQTKANGHGNSQLDFDRQGTAMGRTEAAARSLLAEIADDERS